MAEHSLASVIDKNFLECGICYDSFNDPRGLPCLHAFCCQCLVDWSKACSEDQSVLSCPMCKTVYPIPEGGVRAFPPHIYVTSLKDTLEAEKKIAGQIQQCEKHAGELKRNFCEECQIAICPDCCTFDKDHKGHRFLRLKDVAKRYANTLEDLSKKSEEVEKKYNAAFQQTEQVEINLERASKAAKDEIDRVKNELLQRVKELAIDHKKDIDIKIKERTNDIDRVKKTIQSELNSIKRAREQGISTINSASEYEIVSLYESLSVTLNDAISSKPLVANRRLSYIDFEATNIEIKSLGRISWEKHKMVKNNEINNQATCETARPSSPADIKVQHHKQKMKVGTLPIALDRTPNINTRSRPVAAKTFSSPARIEMTKSRWTESSQIRISQEDGPHLGPQAIAVHPNGDIAVTSWKAPAKVFSRNSNVKYILRESPIDVFDIAITPNNQYVLTGKNGFHRYDCQGVLLSTTPTFDVNNEPSNPRSVAVDSRGRIIVGLGFNKHKTVSVHQPDGTVISKFETPEPPRRIACTANDELVISFYNDNTLRVMNQSGYTRARIREPPPGVNTWCPVSVCCNKKGELFVGNCGQPRAVHSYVFLDGEYRYSDCITTMEAKPYGIALSTNEEELFVVDFHNDLIKIFRSTLKE